jgi:hypothetical protein
MIYKRTRNVRAVGFWCVSRDDEQSGDRNQQGKKSFGCQGGVADGVRNTAGRHAEAGRQTGVRTRARLLCQ